MSESAGEKPALIFQLRPYLNFDVVAFLIKSRAGRGFTNPYHLLQSFTKADDIVSRGVAV